MSIVLFVSVLIALIIILIGFFVVNQGKTQKKTKLESYILREEEIDINALAQKRSLDSFHGRIYNQYFSKYMNDTNKQKLAKSFGIKLEKLDIKIKDVGLARIITVEEILALKVMGLSGAILFALIGTVMNVNLFFIILGALIYYFCSLFPQSAIESRYKKRNAEIVNRLPDFIDLVRTLIEAGLTLPLAIEEVASKMTGPLAEQFKTVSAESKARGNWILAMENMAFRNDLDALSDFVSDVCIAVKNGTSVADVLTRDADSMRVLKTTTAQAKAKSLSIKLIIPLVVFCFGPLLGLLLGPIAIQFAKNF